MIPFSVKVIWFVLSITGMISTWVVMIPFGTSVGAMWGPGLFCVGNTILQGIFCLGIIWRMDPFLMPKSFCIAQTIIIGFATFLLTGVAGAFSVATSLAVLRPKGWGDVSALQWRNLYLIPVAAFPIVGTVVHTTIILKLDAVHPTDDLHCDSSNPLWTRFFSYAAFPFIVTIPCMYLSAKCLIRIYQTNKHIQQTRKSIMPPEIKQYYSPLEPPKESHAGFSRNRPTSSNLGFSEASFYSANDYPPSPISYPSHTAPLIVTTENSTPQTRNFHLPFRPPMQTINDNLKKHVGDAEVASEVSSTLPTFRDPEPEIKLKTEGHTRSNSTASPNHLAVDSETWRESSGSELYEYQWVQPPKSAELERDAEPRSAMELVSMQSEVNIREDVSEVLGNASRSRSIHMTPPLSDQEPRRNPSLPNLGPAIWRIVLFQSAFGVIQILTCITTIADLASKRSTPTPLGSQHFALLLAAWGPAIVFGHTPAVRKQVMFWRKR